MQRVPAFVAERQPLGVHFVHSFVADGTIVFWTRDAFLIIVRVLVDDSCFFARSFVVSCSDSRVRDRVGSKRCMGKDLC